MSKPIRYIAEIGSSDKISSRLKNISRLKGPLHIIGKRYLATVKSSDGTRYPTTRERIVVVGNNGTCRFGGVCWGYGGAGPHAAVEVLVACGIDRMKAEKFLFRVGLRLGDEQLGADWHILANDPTSMEGFTRYLPKPENHYEYCERILPGLFQNLGISYADNGGRGIIVAHGDKCYGYKDDLEDKGIPFNHTAAIYLLTYCRPYSQQVRSTAAGWVDPKEWIIRNYNQFKPHLPATF